MIAVMNGSTSQSQFFRDSDSNGNEGDDCAYAGSYGHGDKACGEEKTGVKKLPGQYPEGKVYRRVDCPDLLGSRCKCPGQNEYPYHQQHILVAGSLGECRDSFLHGLAAAYCNRIYGSNEESR